MEVITIDSEAFQSLKEQLNRIESYIESKRHTNSVLMKRKIKTGKELSGH